MNMLHSGTIFNRKAIDDLSVRPDPDDVDEALSDSLGGPGVRALWAMYPIGTCAPDLAEPG